MKQYYAIAAFAIFSTLSCTKVLEEKPQESTTDLPMAKPPSGTTTSILQWTKCLGSNVADEPRAIKKTSDGGYIIAANSGGNYNGDIQSPNRGGYDAWIIKLNSNLDTVWQKTYGTPGGEWIIDIIETLDGYVFCGSTRSGTAPENTKAWIVKIGFGGNFINERVFNSSSYSSFFRLAVVPNSSDLIVVGQTKSSETPNYRAGYDAWAVRLSSDFSEIWSRAYGGSLDDQTEGSLIADGADFIISGFTSSTDGDLSSVVKKGGQDAWVFRIDPSTGTMVSGSQKVFGGTANETNAILVAHPSGGFIMSAFTYSNDKDVSGNHGNQDTWVVKLNQDLSLTSVRKCFGGTDIDALRIYHAASDDIILVGSSFSKNGDLSSTKGSGDTWILKLDPNLHKRSSNTFGGNQHDGAWGVVPTGHLGGYLVLGRTQSLNGDVVGNHGGIDVWLLKIQY
jgi:hypothetical protein